MEIIWRKEILRSVLKKERYGLCIGGDGKGFFRIFFIIIVFVFREGERVMDLKVCN